MGDQVWLTYPEAAKRTRSSDRTVRRCRRQGMPMEWRIDESGQRYRVVELDVLLAWWRAKMQASPVHFYQTRKRIIEAGNEAPPVPARFTRRKQDVPPETESPQQDPEQAGAASGPTLADVIAELPEFIGQHAHAALIRAMEYTPPACDGLEAFTHDGFADPEQTEMMRGICHACPLREPCRTFAVAGKPTAGMWAGMTPAEIRILSVPAGIRAESGRNNAAPATETTRPGHDGEHSTRPRARG